MKFFNFSLFIFPLLAIASPHNHRHVRRGGGASFTWYRTGLGACGHHNSDGDYIVALSARIWNGGSHCGDKISITINGKTATATVADECMGCDPNHVDMSPGLFTHFASLGTGEIHGEWHFGSGGGGGEEESRPPPPKPKPVVHHDPPKPSKHKTIRPTSTKSEEPSSTTSSTSEKAATTSSTPTPTPTPAAVPTETVQNPMGNLQALNQLYLAYANIIIDGN